MNVYTPNNEKIVHNTSVDFGRRTVLKPVHIVQYDEGLPVLAVSLYLDGVPYTIPENAEVNIRLSKKDNTFVYNPALGCDNERHIAYFEVTQQMTSFKGRVTPIVEIAVGEGIAGSSCIYLDIDRNPIQEGDIESSVEYISVKEYVERAETAASTATTAETNAKDSETKAKTSETNAKTSETKAKTSETKAKDSETKAKTSETNAKTSETNAKDSETKAKTSETNAKTSETNAKTSETNAKDSETKAKTSETNAKTSETEAKTSETNAKDSETNAANSASAAQAVYEEVLDTDFGHFTSYLANKHAVLQPIRDSSGNLILSSDEENLQGTIKFVEAQEVYNLIERVAILEMLLMSIFRDISVNKVNEISSISETLNNVKYHADEVPGILDSLNAIEQHAIYDAEY